MNVTYLCPHCEATTRAEFTDESSELTCRRCGGVVSVPRGAVQGEEVHRCLVCPSTDLYLRKDFSQALGVTIVAVGLAASCIPWYFHWWYGTYAILFATALIDVILYLFTGNMVQCYRCQAQYRGVTESERHGAFNLEVHEKHRQQMARQ